ncbi:HAD family phosphatase [Rugosimonospora acidiphila]|uniref:HAD family phosphatase n=1 Tax=Rugosimonospora acidiphila TaxID=556531 RepID=A0ABP9SUV7_9ACTN
MIQAVVFDLDGILIDSEPVWEEVRRAYVDRNGGQWQPDSQSRLMGMSTSEWARYLSGDLGVGKDPAVVAEEVIAEMGRRYEVDLPLMPGAVDTVYRMGDGYRRALASSSPRSLIDRVLDSAELTQAFEVTISTEEVARGKPEPDVYLAIADRLRLGPEACIAVEDSSNGLRSASAAGMAVIAIPHPSYPPQFDALALADLTLDNLSELTMERISSVPERD